MKNIKKLLLTFFSAVVIVLSAFFLSACDSKTNDKSIVALNLKIGDNISSEQYIEFEYGKDLGSVLSELSYFFTYSDGTSVEINENNFSQAEIAKMQETYKENFYVYVRYDDIIQEEVWKVYEGSTAPSAKLDVGQYKYEIEINGKSAKVSLSVYKKTDSARNVSIVIVENSNTNWGNNLNQSSFKFGMPEYKSFYSEETYTSNYKAYAIGRNNDNYNVVLTGSKVMSIYAMPEIFTNENTYIPQELSNYVNLYDNLKEKYDAIEVLGENNEVDNHETYLRKQTFLSTFGTKISIDRTYENEDALIINTEILKPGKYYTFAWYVDANYEDCYTEPYPILNVEKGVFNWQKSLHIDGEDWNSDVISNLVENLNLTVTYNFYKDSNLFNTFNNLGQTTKKALPASELNTNRAQLSYNESVFEGISSTVIWGGRNALGWGHFVINEKRFNNDIFYDCSNNGDIIKAKFVLDEFYDYYENDPTEYDVTLNINKCLINKPYSTGSLSYEYNGEEIDVTTDLNNGVNGYIRIENGNLFNITGTQVATDINNYSITFTLKDNINYGFYEETDDYNYGLDGTFNWSIEKINLGDMGYFSKEYTYNGNTNSNSEITYVSGQKQIEINLLNNTRYNLMKGKTGINSHMVWQILNSNDIVGANLTQNGDEAVFSFTSLSNSWADITLKVNIAETAYSKPFEGEIYFRILKANFNTQEKETILAELPATEEEDEYGNIDIKATNKIRISNLYLVLPNDAVPNSQTGLGAWKLYHYDNSIGEYGDYVEVNNGDDVSSCDFFYGWIFKFVPSDAMYNAIDYVSVEIELYNENLPEDFVSNTLMSEVTFSFDSSKNAYVATGSYATITLEENYNGGQGAFVTPNTLPTHKTNSDISGEWFLSYENENGTLIKCGNNSILYYSFFPSEDFLKQEERNWKIVFVPDNSAYNSLEILTHVVFN